jgi:DNA polymerase
MTPYQLHVAKYRHCKRCALSQQRNKVVFVRGVLPCDILFIGEAPGSSEDVLGRPFVGPAGKLLDRIIQEGLDKRKTFAITNLVGCMPKDGANAKGEPSLEAIKACREKLLELIALAKPKVIVVVGGLARKHVPFIAGVRQVDLIHPAAILRMDVSQQGLAYQRSVIVLRDVFDVPF